MRKDDESSEAEEASYSLSTLFVGIYKIQPLQLIANRLLVSALTRRRAGFPNNRYN